MTESYGGPSGIALRVVLTVIAAVLLAVTILAPNMQWLSITLAAALFIGLIAIVVLGIRRRRSDR